MIIVEDFQCSIQNLIRHASEQNCHWECRSLSKLKCRWWVLEKNNWSIKSASCVGILASLLRFNKKSSDRSSHLNCIITHEWVHLVYQLDSTETHLLGNWYAMAANIFITILRAVKMMIVAQKNYTLWEYHYLMDLCDKYVSRGFKTNDNKIIENNSLLWISKQSFLYFEIFR